MQWVRIAADSLRGCVKGVQSSERSVWCSSRVLMESWAAVWWGLSARLGARGATCVAVGSEFTQRVKIKPVS